MAKSFSNPLKVHLKFDTGMGRLGFMPDDASLVIEHLAGVDNIQIEGLMSHLSSSEIRDEHGIGQINTFKKIIEVFLKKVFSLRSFTWQIAVLSLTIRNPLHHGAHRHQPVWIALF